MNEHQQRAHDLFFNTNLNQAQIAEILSINRKTLYGWIKEGEWIRMRAVVSHMPYSLVEQYLTQLAALNAEIAMREKPYPTKDEAEIMRKLSVTINHIKGNRSTATETIEVLSSFTRKLQKKDPDLTKKLIVHMDSYIKDMTDKSVVTDRLRYRKIEKEYEQEFLQWQATHPAEPTTYESPMSPSPLEVYPDSSSGRAGVRPTADCKLPTNSAIEPLSNSAIEKRGANGVSEKDANTAEPATVAPNKENTNVNIPQNKNKKSGVLNPPPGIKMNRAERRRLIKFRPHHKRK